MLACTLSCRDDMARHARPPTEYHDRGFIQAAENLISAEDWALAAAYAVAEWVVDYLGPFFWIALAAAFLVAELGR